MAGYFVSLLVDGRVIACGSTTIIVPSAGNYALTIRIPDLQEIAKVLTISRHTDPTCDPGTPVNEKISGNVVGFTMVGVGAGTTLTVEAIAVGP